MASEPKKSIRIGGASGYWGDSNAAPAQLVDKGDIDYLVFDYLAEVTMAILTRAKFKNPNAGYAIDFIDPILKNHLRELRQRRMAGHFTHVGLAKLLKLWHQVVAFHHRHFEVNLLLAGDVA